MPPSPRFRWIALGPTLATLVLGLCPAAEASGRGGKGKAGRTAGSAPRIVPPRAGAGGVPASAPVPQGSPATDVQEAVWARIRELETQQWQAELKNWTAQAATGKPSPRQADTLTLLACRSRAGDVRRIDLPSDLRIRSVAGLEEESCALLAQVGKERWLLVASRAEKGWLPEPLDTLPGGVEELAAGPGRSIDAYDPGGHQLFRFHLERRGSRWAARREVFLTRDALEAHGILAGSGVHHAVAPDGGLVLSHIGGVVKVPADPGSKWEWLMGGPSPSRRPVPWRVLPWTVQDFKGGSVQVPPKAPRLAVNGRDDVLLLEPESGTLQGLLTGSRKWVERWTDAWPDRFLPSRIAGWGNAFVLCGRPLLSTKDTIHVRILDLQAGTVEDPQVQLRIAWVGLVTGEWHGFSLDLSFAYNETPYATGLVRVDKYGLQQTWIVRHTRCPHWRSGFTEKAGDFATPEITGFTTYRF